MADLSYTIQPGDWLSKITGRYYGDIHLGDELARYNGLPDPDRIYPGDTLRLPDVLAGQPRRGAATPRMAWEQPLFPAPPAASTPPGGLPPPTAASAGPNTSLPPAAWLMLGLGLLTLALMNRR